MSDVEKDTEVTTEESDFEGHKKARHANDEPGSDVNDDSESDFEGHKKARHANDEPGSDVNDDSESDFEGHKKSRGE